MAILRKRQLHEMPKADIEKQLAELKLELAKERAQIAVGGSPKNPGRIKEIKRTIARILTELKERGSKYKVMKK